MHLFQVLRRLISFREKIYLDQIAMGAPRTYLADNGEEIVIQIDSRSNVPSGVRGESMSCSPGTFIVS